MLLCTAAFFLPLLSQAQCPDFTNETITGNASVMCEGDMITISMDGTDLPAGSNIDFYIVEGTQNPYLGQGIQIGSVPVTVEECTNLPEVLYIMVNPDNAQVGSGNDKCDEFMVIWTGSGGFSTTDIVVTNLSNGSFQWNNFVAGNAATFSCGVSLPPGPVPPNAILIIQGSPSNTIPIDIDDLCAEGLPVYIIANNDFTCTGGWFDNDSPCASCPVQIDISGAPCTYSFDVDYMPPGSSTNGWGWSNQGSGVFGDVVPPLTIPTFVPEGLMIADFNWTVPADYCETIGIEEGFFVGILDPPPAGACQDIFTPYFPFQISCPSMSLSGGGIVCQGNCPDEPNFVEFTIEGFDVPFTADLIVTASVFPSFPINDLDITDGQHLNICLDGFLPSFDPSTQTLTVPTFAIGITATVSVVSVTSASGCPVTVNPSSVSLEFIEAPIADAGPDQTICSYEMVTVDGSIQGSATQGMWSTDGDGNFDDPNSLVTTYELGPTDISSGSVVLTLTATDPDDACIPATSDLQVFIDPSMIIETNSPLTICNTDVAFITATITGTNEPGMWETGGDGDFDDPEDPTTIYTPGFGDLADGIVTLYYNPVDPDVCVASSEPLVLIIVDAPLVTVPQDLEICADEFANIVIDVTGDFTNIIWNAVGDGTLVLNNNMDVTYTPGPQDIDDMFTVVQVIVVSLYPECGQTTYNIGINIMDCDCPPLQIMAPSSALCQENDQLDLTSLLIEGGPGMWSISTSPPGGNPAVIVNDVFITNQSNFGQYTITYSLTTPEPGCPFSSSEFITVSPLIIPDLGQNIIRCSGDPATINVIFSPAVPSSFQWETLGNGSFTSSSLLSATYSPGPGDAGQNVGIIYHVPANGCPAQSDTVFIIYEDLPFATFPDDTFGICNETDKGSVINFPSLIIAGNTTGTWTNLSGVPVSLADPTAVDFNGIPEGFYQFNYRTNSGGACPDQDYIITISVMECACPFIDSNPIPTGICNSQATLNLNAFVMAGAPGVWQIISAPVGPNPATLIGPNLQTGNALQGEYLVRFTFDSAPIDGCPDSAEIEVFIQEVPFVSLGNDTSVCGAGLIELMGSFTGSAIDVQWSGNGSGNFTSPTGLPNQYQSSGADVIQTNVLLIAETIDTFGFCVPSRDTIGFNFSTPAFAQFSQVSTSVCNNPDSNSVVNLQSFLLSGDITGTWIDINGSGVNLANLSNVDFDGIASGTYVFEYSTNSAVLPCVDSTYTFSVFVEDCTCPPFQINAIPGPLCIGDVFDLQSLVVDAAPGFWSIVSGPAGATTPVINVDQLITNGSDPGSYIISYRLIDSIADCIATIYVNVDLERTPTASAISFDCDELSMTYDISFASDAIMVTADFGIVTETSPDLFIIEDIPSGQDVIISMTSATGQCPATVPVSSPNCLCTLVIEDISDTILLCPGDTIVLIPLITGAQGLAFSTWIGKTTVMRPTYPVFEAGNYVWIVRDSAGCEQRDSFSVALINELTLDLSSVPPTCEGLDDGQIIINSISGGVGPYSVQIDNGPQFISDVWPDSISQIGVGVHDIIVTDISGCDQSFTIDIDDASAGVLSLGPDITISLGDSVLIPTQISDIDISQITWTPPGIASSSAPFWFKPDETTTITVQVVDDQGCMYSDDKKITIFFEQNFFVPNVFSPNGDQINDLLEISFSVNPITIQTFEIFDRWGDMVFRSSESNSVSWNGTFDGKDVPSGVFVIKMIYVDSDGEPHVFVQDLTIIR